MRRITPVASLIAAVLALSVGLVACGDDGGNSSANKSGDTAKLGGDVRLWIMPNGPKPKEDMEALVKPFEEKNGVKVNVEVVGWDVQFDRIRNSAISGEGPDVTQAGTTQVPFFAALGGFEDIGNRVEDIGGKAAYPDGVWQTTQVVGRDGTWALPWFTEARAIYYRKDVLKKAGVDEATAFTDWDAFRATLEKVKQVKSIGGEKIEPFGSPGKKAFDLVHHVMPFVWDAGGAELSDGQLEVRDRLAAGRAGPEVHGRPASPRASTTRASSSATARRSRTSSRAGASRSGWAARGCSARSSAPTTRTGSPRLARTSGSRRCRPARRARATRSSAART